MAGFTVNAEEATRLADEMAAKRAILLPRVRAATVAAGRQIRALAFQGAPRGKHTQTIGFARGYATRTKQFANGTEVTIENKSPLGAIIVFGTSTSGPHDSPGAALAAVDPSFTEAIMDAAEAAL